MSARQLVTCPFEVVRAFYQSGGSHVAAFMRLRVYSKAV